MNNKHLKKTLELIRRTGDRGIIIDEESDELFVLMGTEAYEKLLPSVPTSTVRSTETIADEQSLPGDRQVSDELDDYVLDDIREIEERRRVATEPAAPVSFAKAAAPVAFEFKQNNVVSEESLADVPHDGEEEEKFYLEPVE